MFPEFVCIWSMLMPSGQGSRKKASGLLEVELWIVVTHYVAAGDWAWFFAKVISALNWHIVSQAPYVMLYMVP